METTDRLRLVIVEDNRDLCNVLESFVGEKYDDRFEIVGIAHDGAEGLRMITEQRPDVALIDIVLPQLDGVSLLEKLSDLYLTNEICCVILTAVSHEDVTRKAIALGARFYFLKPFDNDALFRRILAIEEDIRARKAARINNQRTGSHNKRLVDQSPEKYATHTLQTIGIPSNLTGYYYLRRAIVLCIADEGKLDALTKALYPMIGTEFKTTGSRVERSIRHSIEKAWKAGCAEKYYRLLGRNIPDNPPKPSNGMFIMDFVDFYKSNRR